MSTKRLNRNERSQDTINETIRKLQEKDEAIGNMPLAVTSGGTGQTTAAEAIGELTQALTEDTAPDRQLDFAAVYDASADTGKKVALYNVAGSAVLASGSVSAGASLDLALDTYTQFKIFKLFLYNITPESDAALYMRFSDDGGSTFEADAADYWWVNAIHRADDGADLSNNDESDSEIQIGTATIEATAGADASYEVTIYNPAASSRTNASWVGHSISDDAGFTWRTVHGSGGSLVAGASTDVRILASTGNITLNYTLMGII